jgi:hypothetical protein
MKNPILVYALARLGVFIAILSAFLLLRFDPILATVFATMLSFSFSLIFLRKWREASSAKIAESVTKPKKGIDEASED